MASPTIILIGGEFTLHGGTRFDTRQPMEGDAWDALQRAACFRSEHWWATAASLAELILRDHDPTGWILAWAPKSLYVADGDGGVKRRGLRTELGSKRTDDLMADRFSGSGRAIQADRSSATWRLLEAKFRFEDLRYDAPPTVFVGACHDFDDMGIVGNALAPFDGLSDVGAPGFWILPDTAVVRNKLDEFRRRRSKRRAPDDTARVADIRPVVRDADLRITYWFDGSTEREASNLEAARRFLNESSGAGARFLDLANGADRPDSPLTPTAFPAPVGTRQAAPSEIRSDLRQLRGERRATLQAGLASAHEAHRAMEPAFEESTLAWQPHRLENGEFSSWTLSIGPPQYNPLLGDISLLKLDLKALKRSLRLQVHATFHTESGAVERFVHEQASHFARELDLPAPKSSNRDLLNARGYGWADQPDDRVEFTTAICKATEQILPTLARLASDLEPAFDRWMRTEGARIAQTSDSSRGRGTSSSASSRRGIHSRSETSEAGPRRPGLLARLFGRG